MTEPVVVRSLAEAHEQIKACALAIGNFDGVHLGHQLLLATTVEEAQHRGLMPSVLTFDPHPTTIVAPERVPEQICGLEERIALLAKAGAAQILVLPFTADLARLSPREFLQQVLRDSLKTEVVIVGQNFRFGHRQAGDVAALQTVGPELGFDSRVVPPVVLRGEVVSSSAIRRYLRAGMIPKANRLLGRCFSIPGPVVSGFGIGSKQTVPTLNLRPIPGQVTPHGVYISRTIDEPQGRTWHSITNIGNRPTFAGNEVTIETFLLSPFSEPTPDQIRVELLRFVREERSFADASALREQIMRDVGRANAYWRRISASQKAIPSIY